MDSLRYSIGLRAHGQRDPLIEYKAEAFKIFEELMVTIKTEICHNIFRSASSLMAFENFLKNAPQKPTHQAAAQRIFRPGYQTRRQRRRQRSRRRHGKSGESQAGAFRPQSGPQRSMSLRQREKIQTMLREVIRLRSAAR